MKHNFLHPLLLPIYLCSVVPVVEAQQQGFYVYDGKKLQLMSERPADESYLQWQIWLYQAGVHIPHRTAGLPYSRWGLIEGTSPESVTEQLETFQSFERAYSNFFGEGEWGEHTFFNPLGLIAITSDAVKSEPTEAFELSQLDHQMNTLIAALQPSLENNKNEGPTSPVKDYFGEVRDCLTQIAKLYSQLGRVQPPLHIIDDGIARTRPAVMQAENSVREITAVLPSVRLPASKAWMFHTQWAGSDGTIQVEIKEAGAGVSVQQTWTGGDGSMTGAVSLTEVPYKEIGGVELQPPRRNGDRTWTVRVQSTHTWFPETLNCPERKTAKRVIRAINLKTEQNSVYLAFSDPAEAHDAYAYFLYHQQLAR